jgi:hypothetical protein
MSKRSSILAGTALVLMGGLALIFTVIGSLLGLNLAGLLWRLWPTIVVGVGLLFVVPPFLVRGNPGLGGLFIPGFPVLTTGALLLLASVLDGWAIWRWLWPMEILSLAMGFLFAAIYMRVIWLIIPAIIIGLNGMAFQFCAITGLWRWWSVLWVVEPLSVGLALLATGVGKRISGLKLAGLILVGVSAGCLLLMLTILGAWWPVALLMAALLILAGLAMLGLGLVRPVLHPSSASE